MLQKGVRQPLHAIIVSFWHSASNHKFKPAEINKTDSYMNKTVSLLLHISPVLYTSSKIFIHVAPTVIFSLVKRPTEMKKKCSLGMTALISSQAKSVTSECDVDIFPTQHWDLFLDCSGAAPAAPQSDGTTSLSDSDLRPRLHDMAHKQNAEYIMTKQYSREKNTT